MELATDALGKVWLVGSALPTEWNGIALTIWTLTPGQEDALAALPEVRAGIMFDGTTFTVVALPPPSPEELRRAEFDAAINADATLIQFKAITKDQFDLWWSTNVTNAAQAIAVLKKLVWLLIRRVL